MTGDIPNGERFSHLYLRSDTDLKDSGRMRMRIASAVIDLVNKVGSEFSFNLGRYVEKETGLRFVQHGPMSDYYDWDDFYGNCNIADVLDSITLIFRFALLNKIGNLSETFLNNVRRIFTEQQIAYTIDDEGGIHPFVDATFEQRRNHAIAGLGGSTYEAARDHLDTADNALMNEDNRQAIRSIFDAAENIIKQMFNGVTQLNNSVIENQLRSLLEQRYSDDDHAKNSTLRGMSSFKQWVNAAHFYRHEPGHPEPHQPPQELTILLISQGFSFVRWLADLNSSDAE